MSRSDRRPRPDERLRAAASRRLTERDRAICEALYEHRVLTSEQLYQLYFATRTRAQVRLLELYRLRVLDRFQPFRRHGSAPFHYLLDELGAAVVASERALEPSELDWSKARALKLASSSQLAHLVEANGFATRLVQALREQPQLRLLEWWGQRRCAHAWGELVRPDGYQALATAEQQPLELCLEWDRGTEPLARLADKLARYAELEAALERTLTVVIVAPSDRREQEIRQTLRSASAAVLLTTASRHAADPLAANWLAPAASERLSLLERARESARSLAAATDPERSDRDQHR